MRTEFRAELLALRDEIGALEFVACGMRHERVLSLATSHFHSGDAMPNTQTRAKLCAAEMRRRRPMCGHTIARTRLRKAIETIAKNHAASPAEYLRAQLEELDQKICALDHAMGDAQLQQARSSAMPDCILPQQKSLDSEPVFAETTITALEREQILLMTPLMALTEKIMQMIDTALNEAPAIQAADASIRTAGDLSMRAIAAADEAFLFRLFRAVKSEEIGPVQWDEGTLNILMRTQFAAHEQHYRALADAHDLLVQNGIETIGRMIVVRDGCSIHVADISLLPEYRGKGIGQRLIGALQQEAVESGLPLRLRVALTNRAAILYQRLGFAFTDAGEPYRLMEWLPSA